MRRKSPGPGYPERMKTIVVAVDFSPVTTAVCRTAATLARRLRAHLAERIAAFKIPAKIWFLDEPLPLNANGKFVKRDLKQQLLGG